ncbi:ABC transporter substrate-binding protein [Microcella humidisoli]|uniref:Extracellular solute-binding protein n=1 Tax=Microcella humidisoli TaxID=2963406 RepID=A0ABY5FZI3_9MICO|nr:extracellular solute-binding protein [Microcella humidisoli]UTT63688.1 extracellular solute-binding protein [Microcella humidisoli]
MTLIAAVGCAPGSGSGVEEPVDGPVTLTVWDGETGGAPDVMLDTLNEEFQQEYPNITIERVSKSFEDLTATVPLSVTDPAPPDIIPVNRGWTQMGRFVEAGQLLALDEYVEQFGWDERFAPAVLREASFSADGSEFGTGSVFGLSYAGQYVGVYYNVEKLAALGAEVPSTYEEFLAIVEEASAAGEIPIQCGVREQWPSIHLMGALQSAFAPKSDVESFIYGAGTGQGSFETEETIQAAEALAEMSGNGSFADGCSGVSVDDAVSQFTSGEGVFFIQGTWFAAQIAEAMGDNVSMFLFPTVDGSEPFVQGGAGYTYGIPTNASHPDEAALYLDFITGPRAAEVLAEAGGLPLLATDVPAGSVLQQSIYDDWAALSGRDGFVPFLDYAAPPLLQSLGASTQELMAGQLTVPEYVSRIQTDYASFVPGS